MKKNFQKDFALTLNYNLKIIQILFKLTSPYLHDLSWFNLNKIRSVRNNRVKNWFLKISAMTSTFEFETWLNVAAHPIP